MVRTPRGGALASLLPRLALRAVSPQAVPGRAWRAVDDVLRGPQRQQVGTDSGACALAIPHRLITRPPRVGTHTHAPAPCSIEIKALTTPSNLFAKYYVEGH